MSKIKDENYYQISGWMTNKLKLKGTTLNVYAIIYGFSQDGESEFKGSRQYLCDFTGATKPTIDKALDDLVEQNLIIRTTDVINNIKFNKYRVNLDTLKNFTTDKETLPPGKETLLGGGKETLPNNNNIYNNRNNNKNIHTKHYFGEYRNILLTDEELDKLNRDYGQIKTEKAIKFLDEAIEMKGYKYKSHYLALKKWVFKAIDGDKKESNGYSKEELNCLLDDLSEIEI